MCGILPYVSHGVCNTQYTFLTENRCLFPEGGRYRPLFRGCRMDYVPAHLVVTYRNVTITVRFTSLSYCNRHFSCSVLVIGFEIQNSFILGELPLNASKKYSIKFKCNAHSLTTSINWILFSASCCVLYYAFSKIIFYFFKFINATFVFQFLEYRTMDKESLKTKWFWVLYTIVRTF
jgi:hypothetical protein